ncbi:MAG: hypothetical protein A3C38_06925 [Planctomycetes bacterium RIFCSPHIGHO2_02_FULL_50_42]|nr:MAG: hypothetical protein A2060_08180 [Planctomycetes bacterium GWA2_50_13]OHB87355.1 MAG: hypothetical protein A3C38_06925 [Planctomycetes bacterium RIFCSPHIGHO2_02_FULL_50_42]OHB92736.1 MAG: hypothetical protein A3E75_03600 [Planctomycetes bacterium RIFCSPHIGHO2_12_FULL_51_37]OHB95209.1 MAG: hypothetical protein A3I59_04150 [Planctomycetes bacterium RIFCSPLOWO2_02_FULL_50_16]OHC04340.1 MAG: hypothetical protein A3G17_03385 [Planctomycetes bacterium RIFCSPLOWO2_12_FULL_50_35]
MEPVIRGLSLKIDENPGLKAITALVAYKVSENQEDKGTEANFRKAEAAVAEYVTDHFKKPEDFLVRIPKACKGTKALQDVAEAIYRYYYRSKGLTFEMVRNRIGRDKDMALMAITDLIAYKIYQSPEDKGPEVNSITAETFVAQYISENFTSLEDFDRRLQELGHDVSALRSFADNIYEHYCKR